MINSYGIKCCNISAGTCRGFYSLAIPVAGNTVVPNAGGGSISDRLAACIHHGGIEEKVATGFKQTIEK